MMNSNILKGLFTLVLLAVLAGCGGSSSSSSNPNPGGGGDGGGDNGGDNGDGGDNGEEVISLTPIPPEPMLPGEDDAGMAMVYPIQSSYEIPITATPIVRYTKPVAGIDFILNSTYLLEGPSSDGVEVPTTQVLADEGRTVILVPETNLKPNTYYSIGYRFLSGNAGFENFTTGGDPASDDIEVRATDEAEFALVRMRPDNAMRNYPMNNDYFGANTVIRLMHTQPIDPATVNYAEDGNIKLVRTDDDTFVDANVVVSDRTIVIDPLEELPADVTHKVIYEGNTGDAIHSTYDQPYNPSNDNTTFQIYSSYGWTPGWPNGIPAEVGLDFGELEQNSPLTDWFVNELAGDGEAMMTADLSSVPGFPHFSPAMQYFRIKNDALSGDEFEPMGRDLGEDAGVIKVTFPTDLTGYVSDFNGTYQVRAFVQAAIALDDGEPQTVAMDMAGYLTQPAAPGDDVVIDVVGAVDPALLGQPREPGNGMVTFQFRVPTSDLGTD